MFVRLQVYLIVANEVLRVAKGSDSTRWFKDTWFQVVNEQHPTLVKGEDDVGRMLSGKYNITDKHWPILHQVLGLADYGVRMKDAWATVGEGDQKRLALSPDDFAILLRKHRDKYGDPLEWIRQTSDILLSLDARPIFPEGPGLVPVQNRAMFSRDFEEPHGIEDSSIDFEVARGSKLQLSLTAQAEGRLIVFSHLEGSGTFATLRDWLDSSENRRRGARVNSGPIVANGDAGVRDVIAVNWPQSIPLERYGLAGLFNGANGRGRYEVSPDEVRVIGSVAYQTRDESRDQRVHVEARKLRISDPDDLTTANV